MATYKVKTDDKEYSVKVVDAAGGGATVTVEGWTFHVEPSGPSLPAAPAPVAATPSAATPAAAPAAAPAGPAGPGVIVAPIPGVITQLCVKVGEEVSAGQVVLKLEAMKMEDDISTASAGTVKEISVSEGAEVRDGQPLITIG